MQRRNVYAPRVHSEICAIIAMAWCPSLFVTSRCSVETAEKIEVIFGLELYLDVFYIVLKETRVSAKRSPRLVDRRKCKHRKFITLSDHLRLQYVSRDTECRYK